MYRIKIDRSRCIGCLTCVTACVVSHETESGDARNRVTIDRDIQPSPIFCRHCDRPECTYTCMTGAMKKNPVTGYVEYDKEQCASCYMCIMSCPYGILKYDSITHLEIMKGKECVTVHPEEKEVILADGTTVSYDKLLIATGSHTFIPPVKNLKTAKNVVGFRNVDDIELLKEAAKTAKHMVVVGAGLVGLDCTSGLLDLGVKVTIVEMDKWMLCKQLDEKAAKTYQDAFAARGVKQYYGVGMTEAVLDENNVAVAAKFSDGTELPCDFIVVTAGVRSNVEFLADSGIETSRFGLIYDETGKTNIDSIYGAGDVSGTGTIWPVAVKEGIVAASNMVGVPRKMTDFFTSKSTMNFMGINSMSLGTVNNLDDSYQVEIQETENTYKKIVHKDGKIVGAILRGDLAYGGILQQLIARHIDITKVRKPIFDIDYSDFFHIKDNFEFYYDTEGE